jgi:peptide/nickel transport system permease protein
VTVTVPPTVPAGAPPPGQASLALIRPRSRRGLPGLRGTGTLGHVCAVVVLLVLLVALFGGLLAPHDPDFVQIRFANVGPYQDYYLGFDGRGRDLLSRLLVGARTTVLGAVVVALVSVTLGVLLSVASAWLGGWFDTVVGAVLDMLFAFPGILIAVLAAAVFGPSLQAASIALAVAYTPYIARVLRGAALRERAQAYVSALEVQGLGGWAICARHLVPNILGLVVAQGTILFGYATVDLATVSFLGLGVQSPQADWGVMVAEGRTGVLQGYPLESLAAGLGIVLMVVAVNLLGERLTERAEAGGGR